MTLRLALQNATFFLLLTLLFFSCKKDLEEIANQPPLAHAGADRLIILPQDSVNLDGAASSDVDGTITSYKWEKIAGPQQLMVMSANTAQTAVTRLEEGVYHFRLTVNDNSGNSASDTVQVTVNRSDLTNKPPVAKAGADQLITLPNNTVMLSGNLSQDPDGTIATWQWTKISGPASFLIADPTQVSTSATNLTVGIYHFELRVTDNDGHFAADTVQVTVTAMGTCNETELSVISGPGELGEFGSLSVARSDNMMTAAAAGKLLFAGGFFFANNNYHYSGRVDIYNFTTKTWSTAELSHRSYYQHVTAGNKILFISYEGGMDVYDAQANAWSVLPSIPAAGRHHPSIAVLGSKVFFAGGFSNNMTTSSSQVDIYDAATGSWTTSQLSEARAGMIPVAIGNKVVFAGGYKRWNWWDEGPEDPSKRVDIYDAATNTWSSSDLPQPVFHGDAAVVGNKALFVFDGTNNVSIYDAVSNTWSAVSLSMPRTGARVMASGGKFLVAGGLSAGSGEVSRVDIYDAGTGSLSVGNMSHPGYVSWFVDLGNKLLLGVLSNNAIDARSVIEVFDVASNSFTPIQLSHRVHTTPVAADGKVYFGDARVEINSGSNDHISCKVWEFQLK